MKPENPCIFTLRSVVKGVPRKSNKKMIWLKRQFRIKNNMRVDIFLITLRVPFDDVKAHGVDERWLFIEADCGRLFFFIDADALMLFPWVRKRRNGVVRFPETLKNCVFSFADSSMAELNSLSCVNEEHGTYAIRQQKNWNFWPMLWQRVIEEEIFFSRRSLQF